MPKTVTLGGK